jgi:hypothetical protein
MNDELETKSSRRAIEKYYKHLVLPDTTMLQSLTTDLINYQRALSPYLNRATTFINAAQRLSFAMTPAIHLAPMFAQLEQLIPKMSDSFAAATSVFEAYRSVQLLLPNYLFATGIDISSVTSAAHGLGDAYKNLLESIPDQYTNPIIAPALSLPCYTAAAHYRSLDSLGILETPYDNYLKTDFDERVDSDWDQSKQLVHDANPDWITLLEGAEDAFSSTNPDRVRHASVSLRELLTQILHSLAPDSEVKAKLPDDRWFYKGNPTRKARVFYILSEKYGSDRLLDFIEKDMEAIDSLVQILQKGTHEIVSKISGNELAFIVKRVRLTICQLLIPRSF